MKLKLGDGLNIPIEVAGQAVALVGIRGSGKTNTAGVIAEELLDRGQQIVVLDPTDAWWGLRSDYPVFIFGGPHGDLGLNETDGKTLAEFVVQEKVPIILSLRHLRKGAQRRLVMEFCEELYHLKGRPEYREPLTVFIDEAPQFVPQRVMGEMARLVGAVQDMILLGRNAGFGVVLISQRFATLNADVRTQADTVIVHRLPSPLDRKALTEWIEENATIEEQKDVLSSLAKLATGEAWVWSPFFALFKRAQVRARHTFDSSAAPKHVGSGQARAPKDLKAIDVEKLKGKLAATIEKAKADDPRELRKQIADLKKQLSSTPVRLPPERQAVSTPVLTDADRALLEKLTSRIEQAVSLHHEDLVLAGERLKSALQLVGGEYGAAVTDTTTRAHGQIQALFEAVSIQKLFGKLATVQPQPSPRQPADTRAVPPSRSSAATRPTETRAPRVSDGSGLAGDASLGRAERAILTAAVQRLPKVSSRAQLSVLSGYSIKSSSFANALGGLRSRGLIAGSGDTNEATQAGVDALGDYQPLPTGQALVHHWMSQLGRAEGALLAVFVRHYPSTVPKDVLSEESGYSASSSSFANALGKLRTLELVDGLRASEDLFD